MAIILDLPEYRVLAGLTGTADAARDATLQSLLNVVNDILAKAIRQPLDSATYTRVMDGPATEKLVLPYWPVSPTNLTILRNFSAQGDPSVFNATTDTLTRYTDYDLMIDQPDGTSKCGVLVNLKGIWGQPSWRIPIGRLGSQVVATRGCLKVTWTGGFDQIPSSLKSAAMLMTSRLFYARQRGVPMQGEALNGYSYSASGATALGMLSDPTIADALRPFQEVFVGNG